MRKIGWAPSIVSGSSDRTVFLVVDDFGNRGQVYRESDIETGDLETVIGDMLEGEYQNPVRVVAFNTSQKWSQDVSSDLAHELRRRCDLQLRDMPSFLELFVERHEGRYRNLQLPLPMRLI